MSNKILTIEIAHSCCKQTNINLCNQDVIEAVANEIRIVFGPNKKQVMKTIKSENWDAKIDFIYQGKPKRVSSYNPCY